jgi:hypothetical protein
VACLSGGRRNRHAKTETEDGGREWLGGVSHVEAVGCLRVLSESEQANLDV